MIKEQAALKVSSRKRLWLILVILGFVVIAITAVVLTRGTEPPEDSTERSTQADDPRSVASTFMAEMLTANAPLSFELMSPRLQRQIGRLATWEQYLNDTYANREETVSEPTTEELESADNPKPLRLTYDLEITEEISQSVELVLRQIDGSWKVDEYIAAASTQEP